MSLQASRKSSREGGESSRPTGCPSVVSDCERACEISKYIGPNMSGRWKRSDLELSSREANQMRGKLSLDHARTATIEG